MDTHVLLWWLTEPEKITQKARKIISDRKEHISVSCASLWEMAIKKGLGRLIIPNNLVEVITSEGFDIIPVTAEDALFVSDLPDIHNDPFDRMLVAQSKINDYVLITKDKIIPKYPIVIMKA